LIIRNLLARFELKWDASQLKKATSALDDFARHADLALKAVSAHFVAKALSGFVKNTALAMDEVARSSERLNIAVSSLEALKFAAEQSGVPVETLECSLSTLHKTALEARWGVVESAQKFRLLGISVTEANGQLKNPLKLLDELADRMHSMPNPVKQAWAMDKIFGDEGQMLLPLLKQGSKGLAKFKEEAQKFGMVFDDQAIKRSRDFSKVLKFFNAALRGLARTFVDAFIPAITASLRAFSGAMAALKNFLDTASGLRVLRILLVSISAVLAGLAIKATIAFAPFFLIAIAIAEIILLAEDLWVAFKGGESLFKDLYNWAKGFFNPVQNWINGLTADIESFFGTMSLGFKAISKLVPDFLKNGLITGIEIDADTRGKNLIAPLPSSINNRSQNVSNDVSVAINVQSNQPPKDIAQEISKKLREEMDKERINTFMGVSRYAN